MNLVPVFKVYKKVVEYPFSPTKNILVFSFWFQFILRTEKNYQALSGDLSKHE